MIRAAPAANGLLRFARYGFMPNRLTYCGPVGQDRLLFEYAVEGVDDGGLEPLVKKFSGALPYLQLIARSNGRTDPFDPRVVEAYWIGNELLEGVQVRQLYDHLEQRFSKQLSGRTRDLILGKAPAGARPHHSFHVLDIYSRLGELEHSLVTLDDCRVSWGLVLAVSGSELIVDRQPLVLREGNLMLADPQVAHVTRQFDGYGFVEDAQPGDWVALHWGWACEVLTAKQLRWLERYTRHSLTMANQTL